MCFQKRYRLKNRHTCQTKQRIVVQFDVVVDLQITAAWKSSRIRRFFLHHCVDLDAYVFFKQPFTPTSPSIRDVNIHMRQKKQRINVKFDVCVGLELTVA